VPHTTDLDVTPREVVELASPDAITAFLGKLGYDTADRALLSPEAVGLSGESASAIKRIELLSEDQEQFLRVVFAQPKSLTAKVRNDLVRVLGRSTLDHLLILASDFDTLEFGFLDKRKREHKGPAGGERIQVVPKTISVNRRSPTRLDLRTLRRFTWTCRDALEQFDKLRSVFDAAAYTGEYFQNRGLFSDYFLRDRLREDPAWRDNPSETFAFVRDLLRDAQARWSGKDKETLRNQLLEPLFKKLSFKPTINRPSKTDQTQPDYLLHPVATSGSLVRQLTAAFVYAWDRWLDGPDLNDIDTPEENPGACVVTALDQGIADWIIVTNGRLWRLYSRQAHARATNFYEVDLVEALTASGDTDPNEAFRYWSLFFRPDAFARREGDVSPPVCWLDVILQGSREYAKRLGERLKDRIFVTILTTDGKKGNVSYDPQDGQEIVRGASICLYVLRTASQGDSIFLRVKKYLSGKKPGTKAWHHQHHRVGIQESCPQNNFRRIIASLIPKGNFCNHVINYFPEPECKLPLQMLLAILNSKLADWYFRLGSTNAHVNHYQIYNLPAPAFSSNTPDGRGTDGFVDALRRGRWDEALTLIKPQLVKPPFSPTIMACIIRLVDEIRKIETARGDIARTERSALAPEGQPYQDLIDRILYRMAGLTDAEAQGLEKRLEGML